MKPPLDGWLRHALALAGGMRGSAFQTIDGAFYRVGSLATRRALNLVPGLSAVCW
jgi:hypothetical protein